MLKREDLRTDEQTITDTDALVGSAVPENMRRFIYKIKAINLHTVAQVMTLGKRQNGATSTTTIDHVQFATQYETWVDPDELKDDAVPLYIIEGAGDDGASYLWAKTELGNAYLTIWYVDAPA